VSIPCGILQGTGETPTTWEEYLSPSSLSSENLKVLPENVSTLGLRGVRRNRCGAAKKQARKTKMAEALTGDYGGGQPRPLRSGQLQTCRSLGHLGHRLKGRRRYRNVDPVQLDLHLRRARDYHRVQASARGQPGTILMVGRRRGSRKLGNRAKPEPFGRASGWPLYAMVIQGFRSPERVSHCLKIKISSTQ